MPGKNSSLDARDRESVASYDSTGKQKSFRRLFVRFAEKTSMQGVPYIHTAKFWWAKVIWSFLLLAAIAAMALHLWFLFDQWYTWPITTKVELGFQALDFPQVTICNTNTMHKARLYSYDGAEELRWLVRDLEPENFVSEQYSSNYNYATDSTTDSGQTTPAGAETTPGQSGTAPNGRRKRYVEEYDNVNISRYDPNYENFEDEYIDDEDDYSEALDTQTVIKDVFTQLFMDIPRDDREYLGHRISDMLIECTFNGRKCSANQFQLHQTSEYGNCWTISEKKFRVKKSGPSTGLSLILFLETNEFLKGITNGYGIRVNIQKRNTYPFPADEGIYIPASMETDIALKLVNITRLGGNYGDCNNGVEFRSLYNMTYTRRACQSFCQMSTVFRDCSCFDDEWEEFAFFRNKDLKPCRSTTEVKCLLNVQQQFVSGNISCSCDNPCSEFSYRKSISQRQWPTNDYARVLLEWICDHDIKTCEILRNDLNNPLTVNNNFMKLNIYFEDLNFENITETPEIEIQQFLSDVGGAVGLWIGLSILSLCELIQLIVELCYYGVHKANKGNRRDKNKRSSERNDQTPDGIQSDKGNRWPHTVFGARGRPYESDRPYYERDYYSDNIRRNRERYDGARYYPDNLRDRYDDIRDYRVDYKEAYRPGRRGSAH